MALATRCPHCQTIFKVANDQLKLHAGLVRCGACQQTFNGVEHLVPLDSLRPVAPEQAIVTVNNSVAATDSIVPESPTTPAAAKHVEPAPISTSTLATAITDAPVVNDFSSSLDFDLGDDPASPSLMSEEAVVAHAELETHAALIDTPTADWSLSDSDTDTTEKSIQHEPHFSATDADSVKISSHDLEMHAEVDSSSVEREPYIGDAEAALTNQSISGDDSISDEPFAAIDSHAEAEANNVESVGEDEGDEGDTDLPDFVVRAEREKRRSRITRGLMWFSCLLLLPLMVVQAAYIFRVQIAARLPESKPLLTQACKMLHCQVPLPAQIEMVTMDSNELLKISPEKNIFSLAIQIQNRSSTVQTWPVIELILNDAKDKPVLQRDFLPEEYLSNKGDVEKGFSANGDQSIKLYFALPQLKAAGYHVGMFYP
ncbi:MAG: zinc-ribbon domain-containing protein [Burkholderiales bacterium]|nr:zinc-ribbon domain-containing protein [Burkholderiales bacterium]